MTQEEAQIIAESNTSFSTFPLKAEYKGEIEGLYVFHYIRLGCLGGHIGKPLYATVDEGGFWSLVDDWKDIWSLERAISSLDM